MVLKLKRKSNFNNMFYLTWYIQKTITPACGSLVEGFACIQLRNDWVSEDEQLY